MKNISTNKIIQILLKKELKDIFRDRKSVMMMLFVPVVLYPLIFFVAFMIVSVMATGVGVQSYQVVTDGLASGSELQSRLDESKTDDTGKEKYDIQFYNEKDFEIMVDDYVSENDISREEADFSDEDMAGDLSDIYEDKATNRIRYALDEELIDAYVFYRGDKYTVFYNSSVTNSQFMQGLISDTLDEMNDDVVVKNLEDEGLDPDKILHPIVISETDTATSEQSLGYFLGTFIPFMMIISLMVGVFTPAIDATTGEKERGTLETLLMMPVSNSQIIVAKFFSVALVGLITTLLSIASMAGLGIYMLNLLTSVSDEFALGGISLSTFIPAIGVAVPVLIVLSLFLTAISMCVTCFAKTYKEANNYMSPIMIVVMITGYIGFIPNIEFDRTMAMIPVANVCLLIKNILLFKLDIGLVMIVILSTAVYTGLVILVLGKMYRSEAILFDEGKNSLALLERRSNMRPGGVPTSGDSWFVVMVGFLLLIYVGGLLQTKYGLTGVALSQIVIIALPLAMTIYTKKSIKETFSLYLPGHVDSSYVGVSDDSESTATPKRTSISNLIGAIILGLGVICIGMVVASIMMAIFPEQGSEVTDMLAETFDGSFIAVLAVVAVMPAICEEALFRGYILSGFRSRYSKWITIVGVGVFFGIYHTSIVRFPTTALLGGAFAYIVYKTGSILPGVILHFINNSVAVISMFYPDEIGKIAPFLMEDEISASSAMIMCGVGLCLVAVGSVIMNKFNRKESL